MVAFGLQSTEIVYYNHVRKPTFRHYLQSIKGAAVSEGGREEGGRREEVGEGVGGGRGKGGL